MSRAAATIIGGLILGMDRRRIVEFSFFLAVPTMMAATGLDLAMTIGSFSLNQSLVLLLGCAVSMGVSVIAIRGFLRFIQHHTFVLFGFYRVLLGIIVFLFVI
jgi:undecaprenyl-diphosphatase